MKSGFATQPTGPKVVQSLRESELNFAEGIPLYFPKGNESGDHYEPVWIAAIERLRADDEDYVYWSWQGPTPLIAAMRCYVASKLGDEVEIPEELK